MKIRIGTGSDVHQLIPGESLRLGGLSIPSDVAALGHSDADALIHAICDALLGAASLGDIGSHFPDTDPSYHGTDSTRLLQRVAGMIRECGYSIVNIDSTVELEKPRLRNYIDNIRKNLAAILEIDMMQVSVKAKTSEKLGFVGRREGIRVAAVVLIQQE